MGVGGKAPVEVGRKVGQRHAAQPLHQQGLGIVQRARQGIVDRLLHQTFGLVRAVTHGEHRGRADRVVHVAQGHGFQVARQHPAAAMAFFRTHETGLAQTGQCAAHHHRAALQARGQRLGGHGPLAVRHVQQQVQDR